MKQVYQNILECVGHTPIIKLNQIGREIDHDFYVKLDFLNPGSSVKDRIALQMVEDAEKAGKLKPGGTIVECTSGNTGMGLAMVAAVRGYQCIFVMPDKVSSEKIKALRAYGARVVVTPTAVSPEDPRSYYSVAKRIEKETPNAFLANQYHNLSNPDAHYRNTGPEIWEQMGKDLDYLVVATGTGGTISGAGKYLKEKNPKFKTLAVDPEGSIYYEFFKTGNIPNVFKTYKVEGFGEDFVPGAIDFKMIDDFVQVSDKECFLTARELVKKEGIFAGGSGGGALAGALKYAKGVKGRKSFLVIIPDHGSRYLSKMYDDDWMRENSFLEVDSTPGTLRDLLGPRVGSVHTASPSDRMNDIVARMKKHSISQLPVIDQGKLIGLITEVNLLSAMLSGEASGDDIIGAYMSRDYKALPIAAPVSDLVPMFRESQIAIVLEKEKVVGIVTKIDLVEYLSGKK